MRYQQNVFVLLGSAYRFNLGHCIEESAEAQVLAVDSGGKKSNN